MPAVSLTDYTSQQAELARRQKLADLLSEQGQQDIPIQSYNGTQAAIPWTAVLAKMLQSGAGAYMSRKSASDEDDLRKAMATGYMKDTGAAPAATTAPVSPAMPAAPSGPAFDPNSAMPGEPGSGGMSAPAGPSPQNIAAALGNDPTAAPAPQGAPPQAMAAALGGQPPQQAPMPQPMPQPPVAPPAAAVAQAAPAPAPVDRLALAQAAVQQARQVALKYVGTPYATDAAARVKAAQEQVTKIQDLQDASAEKQADRAASVARTVALVNASDQIPAAMKPAFLAGAQADPDLAKTIMSKMVGDAFTHALVPAPPAALAGYPQGTVAQMDPVTKELKNIYNPVPNLMAIANEKLHAQEVSISGGRLAVEQHNSQRADAVFKAGVGGMSSDAQTALNDAIAAGKLPPSRVSSRTASIWGNFFLQNPNANATQIDAVARGAASPIMQRTLASLQAIPDTVNNLVSAGKALNYPDLKIAGIAEKWTQGQVNDPKLVNYLTQRKDAILSLAQAFRGTSATDQATKLEEEAMHPTLSPRALEGWAKGQLTAALPKISAYQKYDPSGDTAKAVAAIQSQITALSGGPATHQPYADPAKEARYQAWLKSHGG